MGEVGQALLLQERLALHELLRVGLAREEDLKLLQQVAQAQLGLAPPSLQQLFKEVSLREEWRVGREQLLLQQLQASTLTCVRGRDVGHIQQLARQVQQMCLRQVQKGRVQTKCNQRLPTQCGPSTAHHVSSPTAPWRAAAAAGTSAKQDSNTDKSLPPVASMRSSLGAALSIYNSSLVSKKPAGSDPVMRMPNSNTEACKPGALAADPTAYLAGVATRTRSSGGVGNVQGFRPPAQCDTVRLIRASSETTHSSKGCTSTARFNRATSNVQRRHRQQQAPQLLTADQLLQQLLLQPAASSAPSSGSSTLCSSVHITTKGSLGDAGTTGAAATNTAALKTQPKDRPMTAPIPSAVPAAVQQEPVRFQKLLRLQGMLLSGLQQHVEGGGVPAAVAALLDSLQHMQQHFADCLVEAKKLAFEAAGNPPSPRAGHARSVAGWGRVLSLGQLALSPADIARLAVLRQHIAARRIQRSVRGHLRRCHAAAAAREAAARAAAAAHRLRSHAALVVQRYWRGYKGRAAARQHAIQVVQMRRQSALQITRRLIAALRIQRSWRAFVKQRRAMQALATPLSQHAMATIAELHSACSSRCQHAQHEAGDMAHGKHEQQQQRILHSIVRLQALARGWLVRRSTNLWWARSLAQLHRKRMAARAWQAHQAYLQDALPLQEQYIESLEEDARVAAAVRQAASKEQHAVEQAWDAWLQRQVCIARAQPLPRGWVPYTASNGQPAAYLDTHTGALHAHHPADLQLHSFAADQHQQAVHQLQQSLAALQQHVSAQHAAGEQQRLKLLASMHEAMLRHLA